MRRLRFPIPLSIMLFLALTLGGTYFVRKGIIERHMVAAMEMGDEAMARGLLDAWPCPVNARMPGTGKTLLCWAIDDNHLALARRILALGADANAPYTDGCSDGFSTWTPLECAVAAGDADLVERLLHAGADLKRSGNRFHWPLMMAAENGDLAVMRVLLDHGADVEQSGVDDYRALDHAILANQPAAARLLRARGAGE